MIDRGADFVRTGRRWVRWYPCLPR